MQRNYLSNNVQYQLNTLENQWNHSIRVSALKKVGSIQLEAAYQALQFRKVYVFDAVAVDVISLLLDNQTAVTVGQ